MAQQTPSEVEMPCRPCSTGYRTKRLLKPLLMTFRMYTGTSSPKPSLSLTGIVAYGLYLSRDQTIGRSLPILLVAWSSSIFWLCSNKVWQSLPGLWAFSVWNAAERFYGINVPRVALFSDSPLGYNEACWHLLMGNVSALACWVCYE